MTSLLTTPAGEHLPIETQRELRSALPLAASLIDRALVALWLTHHVAGEAVDALSLAAAVAGQRLLWAPSAAGEAWTPSALHAASDALNWPEPWGKVSALLEGAPRGAWVAPKAMAEVFGG